jgi:hypothetical protein
MHIIIPGCNQTWIFLDWFSEKYSNIKFSENPSSGSRVVPCGTTDGRTARRRDIKPVVAFRNFSNAPKKIERAWPKLYGIPNFEPFCYRQAYG